MGGRVYVRGCEGEVVGECTIMCQVSNISVCTSHCKAVKHIFVHNLTISLASINSTFDGSAL